MTQSNSFQQIINLLSNTLEAYTSAFFLKDPHNKVIDTVCNHSLGKYFKNDFSCPLSKSGLIEKVITKRETIRIGKLGRYIDIGELPFYEKGESGIKGLFAIPVGRDLGVLYVDTKRSWGFAEKEQKLVVEFGQILETLVRSERALDREKMYARMLRLWHNVEEQAVISEDLERYFHGVVSLCHRFVKAHSSYLFLIDNNKGVGRLFAFAGKVQEEFSDSQVPLSEGIIGWITNNKKTLKIRRLETKTKKQFLFNPHEPLPHSGSFLGVPLFVDGEVEAVFGFLWDNEHRWDRDELYILNVVAKRSATVLEKLTLQRQLAIAESIDQVTGLCNDFGFDQVFQKKLIIAQEKSIPMVLAIVQISPWMMVKAHLTCREEKNLRQQIARTIVSTFGKKTILGSPAENRYVFLWFDHTLGEAEKKLTRLKARLMHKCFRQISDLNLEIKSALALFPSDGHTASDLWNTLYLRLLATTHKNYSV